MLKKIRNKIRNLFIAGLLIIVPISITVYLFVFLLNRFDKIFYPAVNKLLNYTGIYLPIGFRIPGLGFAIVVLIVLITGFLTTSIIGKKFIKIGEGAVAKIPLASNIYTGAKQVIEAVATDHSLFKQVVMIEYPRVGLHSIGFVTCDSFSEIQAISKKKIVNVFVPTTPNPTSGVLVFLPEEDVIALSMTVEQGIKLVISGGIVSPNNNHPI